MRALSFIFLGLHVFASPLLQAEDDVFHSPPQALLKTKYASDCGGVNVDLQKDMPPIENQQKLPWCATLGVKALIDYYVHVNNPGDTYQKQVSAFDLNTWDSRSNPKERGKIPHIHVQEGRPFSLLEGAQNPGALYLQEDLSFDQSFFDQDGVIAKLSAYYDLQKKFADTQAPGCRDTSSTSLAIEARFSSILQDLSQAQNKNSFLAAIETKYTLLPQPRVGAKRVEIPPPFNIRDLEAHTGDQFMEELQKNLGNKKPTGIMICATQLRQIPGLDPLYPTPPQYKNTCGGHFMTVIGMQPVNGKCMVHLRNTWGEYWPAPEGDGNVWLPAEDALKILWPQESKSSPATATMISISARRPGAPITNEYISPGYTIVGETFQMLIKKGRITRDNGDTYEGTFQNNMLVEGTQTHTDGTILHGTFDSNGRLQNGYIKGLFNAQRGIYYDGPIVNGQTTSAGKFTDKDGHSLNSP